MQNIFMFLFCLNWNLAGNSLNNLKKKKIEFSNGRTSFKKCNPITSHKVRSAVMDHCKFNAYPWLTLASSGPLSVLIFSIHF